MTRDYKKEYDSYHAKPEQIKNRAQRNKARGMLESEGVVHKGDGKDVDHKRPLSKGGTTTRSNIVAKPKSANRSFKRTSSGAMK
jgi:hypothetical protein